MSVTGSDLPFELVQEILIISAESSLKQAATLAAISHDINRLVKPILLRTFVYWDDDNTWPGFLDEEWLESNGKYARNLLWGLDGTSMNLVLEHCTNLTNIAIWLSSTENDLQDLLEPLSQLRPQRLSTGFVDLFGGQFMENHASLPMFSNLTHLEAANGCTRWDDIEGIQFLPRLTHLSIPESSDADLLSIVKNSLQHCKTLAILVLFSIRSARRRSADEPVADALPLPVGVDEITDPRVVSFKCAYVEEWEVGTRGGRDMWTCAEEIVEGRLQKS